MPPLLPLCSKKKERREGIKCKPEINYAQYLDVKRQQKSVSIMLAVFVFDAIGKDILLKYRRD